jgi:hypothetical protein
MYTDKENFDTWMERIMDRFDHTDKALENLILSDWKLAQQSKTS